MIPDARARAGHCARIGHRRTVQQDAGCEEREVHGVDIEREALLHEFQHEERRAQRRDEDRQQAAFLQPFGERRVG